MTHHLRHSGKGPNPLNVSPRTIFKILFVFCIVGTALWIPAFAGTTMAEDKKAEEPKEEAKAETENDDDTKADVASSRFAPDFCDFEITFPEAPIVAQKCVPDSGCFEVHSYTMVYDLQTTVDVSVTCNPSTPDAYKQYSEGVMKAALAGMVEDKGLTSHEVRYQTLKDEQVKNAAITGAGMTGRSEKIYSGQLWIGPNSVFSVQAELIGSAHTDADKSFGDIMASIKTKKGKQIPRPKKVTLPQSNNQ